MLNTYVFRKFPEVMMIAEESTAYARLHIRWKMAVWV